MATARHPQSETTTERELGCAAPFCVVERQVERDCARCPFAARLWELRQVRGYFVDPRDPSAEAA